MRADSEILVALCEKIFLGFCANIFQTCFLLNNKDEAAATNWNGHKKLNFSSVPWFLFRCVSKLLFSSYMYIHECWLKALTFFYVYVCRLHYMSQYINKVLKQRVQLKIVIFLLQGIFQCRGCTAYFCYWRLHQKVTKLEATCQGVM